MATPGTRSSEPSRRGRSRRLWRAVIGLSILIVVLVVFASQQGGDGGGGGGGPLNAIAEAAERTQREPGGRATIETVVWSPGSKSFTITGQMVFDDEKGRTQGVMTMPRPGSDDPVEMEMVTDGAVMYMRSSMFGSLPGGSEWMKLDMSFAPGLDTPLPANSDAKGELELLEAAGSVQKLGKEDVRGVPTTRYRGTVGVAEQAERMREAGADDFAAETEEKGTPLEFEVWIDADGLVRRTRMISTQQGDDGEGPTTMDARIDFFDFGTIPEIEVPESNEVFDMTDLAKSELGISNDE